MPRKTRQQKLATELRSLRSQLNTPSLSTPVAQTQNYQPVQAGRLADLMGSTSVSNSKVTASDYGHVKGDLKKVAILATIALLIEVALSLTLNFGFAKLIPGLS